MEVHENPRGPAWVRISRWQEDSLCLCKVEDGDGDGDGGGGGGGGGG